MGIWHVTCYSHHRRFKHYVILISKSPPCKESLSQSLQLIMSITCLAFKLVVQHARYTIYVYAALILSRRGWGGASKALTAFLQLSSCKNG